MHMQSLLDFNELTTPTGQGEPLVLPSPGHLADLPEANNKLLEENEFRILDLSSLEFRTISRDLFKRGHSNQLWIVTGHQPEFIHPGVWVKHLVTQRLANHVGGVGANIIVDHDAAKDVSLTIPTERDGKLHKEHVSFAAYRAGIPWELVAPLSQEKLREFAGKVKAAYGLRYGGSLMEMFFAGAQQVKNPVDWVDQSVAGRRAIDAMFGVNLIEKRARQVWGGAFLAQMMIDSERFVASYNQALQEYRRMLRIKGSIHPIPDLVCENGRVELPVWAVRQGMPRQRVFVAGQKDRIEVFAERDLIGTLAVKELQRWETAETELASGIKAGIRPRALTLTLWARLFLSDLFVHGIGGAKYDRITDIIIKKYFGIEPSAISCVSATLRLDLPVAQVGREDLRDLDRRRRDVRYNPDRYVPEKSKVTSLMAARSDLIARSDRLRKQEPGERFERRDVFDRIHKINRQMLQIAPEMEETLVQKRAEMVYLLGQSGIARSREYFIGLFSRQDLQFLSDMVPHFQTSV